MHGGKSPGAPKGNQNALKHGRHTAKHLEEMRAFRDLVREARSLFKLLR